MNSCPGFKASWATSKRAFLSVGAGTSDPSRRREKSPKRRTSRTSGSIEHLPNHGRSVYIPATVSCYTCEDAAEAPLIRSFEMALNVHAKSVGPRPGERNV